MPNNTFIEIIADGDLRYEVLGILKLDIYLKIYVTHASENEIWQSFKVLCMVSFVDPTTEL